MKIIKLITVIVFFSALLNAQTIKKEDYPISQCNKQTYTQEDLKEYKSLIEIGEIQGYNCVGLYYMRAKDYDKAKEYFNKGKEKGSIESYAQLGSLYSNFLNDKDEAINYYTYAAKKGHVKSAHNLGVIYDKKFVYDKALKWYEKSWYEKSFKEGDTYSLLAMGTIYLKQNNLEKAIKIFEKVGELGKSDGYYNLGILYRKNKKIKDLEKAKIYFEKCLDLGNAICAGGMGTVYEDLEDYENAIKWYTKGFELGSKESVTRLGLIYVEKLKDYETAIKWYKKGFEELKCVDCLTNLGSLYANNGNYNKALIWYEKSSELGSLKATYNLGLIYQDYIENKDESIKWYKKAYDMGYLKAIYRLKELGVSYE